MILTNIFSRNNLMIFFLILALAAGLRFAYLDMGYSSDEGWLLKTAGYPLPELFSSLEKGNSVYPPLSPILLHFWLKAGDSEFWVRSYFVFFGLALCALVYLTASLFLGPGYAAMAMLLASLSPLLIWSSRFVRSYIDYAFWNILAVYFLIRMIKRGTSLKNCLGLVISSACAFYTSYLSLTLLAAQGIFVFCFRNKAFIKKWLACLAGLLAVLIPGFYLMFQQMSLATAINPMWQKMGLEFFGLNVGYYARSFLAILGMDPDFLAVSYKSLGLGRPLLLAGVLFTGAALILAIFWFARIVKNRAQAKSQESIFAVLVLVSFALYNFILVELMNFIVQPEYFAPHHVLFILMISLLIYRLMDKNKKAGWAAFFIVCLFFGSRVVPALEPQFETKKAYLYLKKNLDSGACILMAKPTNCYILQDRFLRKIVVRESVRNVASDRYRDPAQAEEYNGPISDAMTQENLVFYRVYGNDEILGMNKFIMDRLENYGYRKMRVQKFKRIDIIFYERGLAS